MTDTELGNAYFTWMYRLVCDKRYTRGSSYKKLLMRLHQIDFTYSHPMDANRVEDGIDLRYRFGYEEGYADSMIAAYLDCRPCSVLEMMIALAYRCEEHIMQNPDIGDRTGQWFWGMIDCLGLIDMEDSYFDAMRTDDVIFRFMARNYKRNGEGGLFRVDDPLHDMRTAEIWYQLNWYLNTII